MNAKTMDVYVYIPVAQAMQQKTDMIRVLSEMSGVVKANSNAYVGKLVDVAYDPALTSCSHIIDHVRQRGYNGYLVGM